MFCGPASPPSEEQLLGQLREHWLLAQARRQHKRGQLLAALLAVAKEVGRPPTVAEYRAAWARRKGTDQAIPNITTIIAQFGSWRQAKEAIELAAAGSPAEVIEARFRGRRVGKVHRYRTATLRETLARCVADLGRVPLVADFEAWRLRELELARAGGDQDFCLPGYSPYRSRWGSWEQALLALGFPPQEIEARLEPGRERGSANLQPFQFKRPNGEKGAK